MSNTLIWLLTTLFCVALQAFYSMMEMAAVSFNRVRLEYYVSKSIKRALWLQYLLQKPSRLFGSVMLGVNIALQVGSESSRQFYQSLHLNPDIAPLTQIFLVVIFAEIVPLFAARRFSEQVIMLGIPILYATYRVFSPVIWVISQLTQLVHNLIKKSDKEFDVFISRDELQRVLETHEDEDEFNSIVSNIFSLRNKMASEVMQPLHTIEMIRANATVADLKKLVANTSQNFIPLFHKSPGNIAAIALPRDYVNVPDNKTLRNLARPPWFLTASTKLMTILSQFRRNRQSVAVVLDANGSAIGILTLDAIIEEIFGDPTLHIESKKERDLPVIERTFAGATKIQDINQEFGIHIETEGDETLAQLMQNLLDHPPKPGDTVVVDRLELTAEETSILGIKSISVKTLDI